MVFCEILDLLWDPFDNVLMKTRTNIFVYFFRQIFTV